MGDFTVGEHKEHPGDFWAHLIANILLRIGYFAGTALFLFFTMYGGRHRYHHHWDWTKNSEYLYAILALSTLAAIFGPYFHRKEVDQGRGSLNEVRRNSERK